MKRLPVIICLLCAGFSTALAQSTEPVPTNRYAMKLERKADGTYALQKEARYAKILDLSKMEGLYEPYVHKNNRLSGKLYNKIETTEYVYRQADGYELRIAVDAAQGDAPAPVMFYVHGGGWSRGSFDSGRSLSKYMAQQHGITGVRVQYTLAGQSGASAEVSIADVLAAVQYIRDHAAELHIDPSRMGFQGTSAGGHLAACAAMKTPEAKVFIGYSGIYDLTTAAITTRAKDPERIAYFGDLDPGYLADCSPIRMIPKKTRIAALLVCGTGDITVECSQSREFAAALRRHKATVDLQEYPGYDHNLTAKASDKMEEIFFLTADFIAKYL